MILEEKIKKKKRTFATKSKASRKLSRQKRAGVVQVMYGVTYRSRRSYS